MFIRSESKQSSSSVLLSQSVNYPNVEIQTQEEWQKGADNAPEPEFVDCFIWLLIGPIMHRRLEGSDPCAVSVV